MYIKDVNNKILVYYTFGELSDRYGIEIPRDAGPQTFENIFKPRAEILLKDVLEERQGNMPRNVKLTISFTDDAYGDILMQVEDKELTEPKPINEDVVTGALEAIREALLGIEFEDKPVVYKFYELGALKNFSSKMEELCKNFDTRLFLKDGDYYIYISKSNPFLNYNAESAGGEIMKGYKKYLSYPVLIKNNAIKVVSNL